MEREDIRSCVNKPLCILFGMNDQDDTDLLTDGSIALAEQIRTIDKRRLRSYIGSLDADTMKRVDKIIKISLEVS